MIAMKQDIMLLPVVQFLICLLIMVIEVFCNATMPSPVKLLVSFFRDGTKRAHQGWSHLNATSIC